MREQSTFLAQPAQDQSAQIAQQEQPSTQTVSDGKLSPQENFKEPKVQNPEALDTFQYCSRVMPCLATTVRSVEKNAQHRKTTTKNRANFQATALLLRDLNTRVKNAKDIAEFRRHELLKRFDGIAQRLAKSAGHDTTLIPLLEADAPVNEAVVNAYRSLLERARVLPRNTELQENASLPEESTPATPAATNTSIRPRMGQNLNRQAPELQESAENQVTPAGISKRINSQLFLAPNFTHKQEKTPILRLANWELLQPLLKSFEQGGNGAATMDLPNPPVVDHVSPPQLKLMKHQSRFIAKVQAGHRSFLLADEPGLGKTAQSLIAASVSQSYPLLVVVPNVVKMNWANEARRWTPNRRVTVINGDGDDIDPYADIFVVNYDILNRHFRWMSQMRFKGMVIDEAHMIKNVSTLRSRHVLALSEQIRMQQTNPLLIALTGTPLINDIDDFRAIWRFLGWITEDKPSEQLLGALERTGYTPANPEFYPRARQSVIDMGIVRRKKEDVVKDLPSKRIVDLPVELDSELARDIRSAESKLAQRLMKQFTLLRKGKLGARLSVEQLIRTVCAQELESANENTGINMFALVRQIGIAKAQLASDYALQLARSVGKVVFFAKHVEVMDKAEEYFQQAGIGYVSVRGNQSVTERQNAIDRFNNDPSVSVIVCSLLAAGVGVNLQASSDVVLAELSWTDAEQLQAIDRVHRIGQKQSVTAWRIVATQTVDQRIAELVDSKANLLARALDGAELPDEQQDPTQLRVLMQMLSNALAQEYSQAG